VRLELPDRAHQRTDTADADRAAASSEEGTR